MTQQDLATRLGVANRTVQNWCSGVTGFPHQPQTDKLQAVFEQSDEWLQAEHGFGLPA